MQKATYKYSIFCVHYICTVQLDFNYFSYENSNFFFKSLKLFVDEGFARLETVQYTVYPHTDSCQFCLRIHLLDLFSVDKINVFSVFYFFVRCLCFLCF